MHIIRDGYIGLDVRVIFIEMQSAADVVVQMQ